MLPSIQNSTDDAVPPLTLAVQLMVPDSCWPVTMLDVTLTVAGVGVGVGVGAGAVPLAIVTFAVADVLPPLDVRAMTVSTWPPFDSVVVASRPSGSALNWYGA